MATSALKSTSRRATEASTSSTASNTKILRRSRSVCSIARTDHKHTPPTHQTDFSEFSNPLFRASNSSPKNDPKSNGTTGEASGTTGTAAGTTGKASGTAGAVNSAESRGRSVTRHTKSGIGRSLSRVRGRSVSRSHYGPYESEKEDILISAPARKRTEHKQVANSGKSSSLTRSQSDVLGKARSSQTIKSGQTCYISEEDSACSIQILNCEDTNSIGSFSEAEEKTTVFEEAKPIHDDCWVSDPATGGIYETVRSEVRRAISDIQNDLEDAIRRNNAPTADMRPDLAIRRNNAPTADMRPDLVNPGAIELVLDIRREYTKKLEESEERARKLRADLSIEEHRGQELIKILKEIVPEPKTSTSQRSHSRRKRSNERKNMSRCLTDEAMAYFDECVSISTFDSSDFSAPEDPPHGSLNSRNTSVGNPWCSLSPSKSNLTFFGEVRGLVDLQTCGHEESMLAVDKSSKSLVDPHAQPDAESSEEMIRPHSDIISYAKQFKVGSDSDTTNVISRKSSYDPDSYKFQGYLDGLLFDKVLLRSTIKSGGLHLCSGGFRNFTF